MTERENACRREVLAQLQPRRSPVKNDRPTDVYEIRLDGSAEWECLTSKGELASLHHKNAKTRRIAGREGRKSQEDDSRIHPAPRQRDRLVQVRLVRNNC
jgi:hypothetical protein